MSTATTIHPDTLGRRSPLYRQLRELGARFEEINGGAVAMDFGDPAAELEAAGHMGLCDLSCLPRCGFKGPGTADWLAAQGLAVPPDSNRASLQEDGGLALRLAPNELLVTSNLDGDDGLTRRLQEAWQAQPVPPAAPRGFPVPRQDSHDWLAVSGARSADMFAKICGIDLRRDHFARGSIAQTSVARTGAVVLRQDLGSTLNFHLLFDSASAVYLWDCLLDAMAEFDGRVVGLQALRSLAG